jgi:hypothetical protein
MISIQIVFLNVPFMLYNNNNNNNNNNNIKLIFVIYVLSYITIHHYVSFAFATLITQEYKQYYILSARI